MTNPIPNPLRALLIGTWIVGLLWFENRRALRSVHRSKLRRDVRNIVVAAPAGAVMQAAEMPLALALSVAMQQRGWGDGRCNSILNALEAKGYGYAFCGG